MRSGKLNLGSFLCKGTLYPPYVICVSCAFMLYILLCPYSSGQAIGHAGLYAFYQQFFSLSEID